MTQKCRILDRITYIQSSLNYLYIYYILLIIIIIGQLVSVVQTRQTTVHTHSCSQSRVIKTQHTNFHKVPQTIHCFNQGLEPSCCEATALATVPQCCPMLCYASYISKTNYIHLTFTHIKLRFAFINIKGICLKKCSEKAGQITDLGILLQSQLGAGLWVSFGPFFLVIGFQFPKVKRSLYDGLTISIGFNSGDLRVVMRSLCDFFRLYL